MSRDLVLKRSCRMSLDAALENAARALANAGYERVSGSARTLHFSARGGTSRVVVEADGVALTFRFEGAVNGPALNEGELTRLVDDLTGQEAGLADVRCPLCATVAAAGEVSCSLCGARLAGAGR